MAEGMGSFPTCKGSVEGRSMMIPFCTSGSSGIGRSGRNFADHAGSGTWLDSKRFGAGASEDEIRSWIEDKKEQ